jgi:hypothetical protein
MRFRGTLERAAGASKPVGWARLDIAGRYAEIAPRAKGYRDE